MMSKFTKAVYFIRKVHMPEKHILYSYAHESLIMQYYNCVPLKGSLYKSMHTFSNWKPGNPAGRAASLQAADDKKLTIYPWQLLVATDDDQKPSVFSHHLTARFSVSNAKCLRSFSWHCRCFVFILTYLQPTAKHPSSGNIINLTSTHCTHSNVTVF